MKTLKKAIVENYKTKFSLLLIIFCLLTKQTFAQTVRYQNSVRGGFTIAANALTLKSGTYVNTSGGTTASSYSDLILPTGSTIVKAILYVEAYVSAANKRITSVKFRWPGAGSYTTLTSASSGFIANPVSSSGYYTQFIIDVTNMIPVSTGYVSALTAGANAGSTGRYSVADPAPIDNSNYGYGWALYVVYTNPVSKYRNITIADTCSQFTSGGTTLNNNITNVTVPSCGTVNAVVGITGCWGDRTGFFGYSDEVNIGKTGTALTGLTDPTTGVTDDILNGTIGFGSQNNVTADGGPSISGNYTGRNPYNTFGGAALQSYMYDADILNASGILPASATPISVTFEQKSTSIDVLGSGAYAVSIDIVGACLSKTVSPSVIPEGGTATYTFTIANTAPCGINLSGIGFTDNLPGSLRVQSPNGVSLSGGTGGTVTAVAGSSSVSLSGLSLAIGQTATITVNVTNVSGQTNADCSTNPTGFTNSFSNISGNTPNLLFCGTSQCLVVGTPLPVELIDFKLIGKNKNYNKLQWTTLSENNSDYFQVEKSVNGVDFEVIGQVKAAGNSSKELNYSYIDNLVSISIVYYRLKLVDRDGQFTYSETLSIENNNSDVLIYPNPSLTGVFKIDLNSFDDPSEILVFNNQGRVIYQFKVEHAKEFEMDLSDLVNGIYYVKVIGLSEIVERKICIQKTK